MATYTSRDIQSTFEGDLVLDSNGDLKLANPLDTYKSAANFLLRTDFGAYAPDKSVGCNLGSFVGKLNTQENQEFMAYNINRVLQNQIFNVNDIEATVVPFDLEEVLCVVKIGGFYLIDGIIQPVNGEVLTYTFPYISMDHLTPIDIT